MHYSYLALVPLKQFTKLLFIAYYAYDLLFLGSNFRGACNFWGDPYVRNWLMSVNFLKLIFFIESFLDCHFWFCNFNHATIQTALSFTVIFFCILNALKSIMKGFFYENLPSSSKMKNKSCNSILQNVIDCSVTFTYNKTSKL